MKGADLVTLGAGDEEPLDAFLSAYSDSSLFLQSNLRRGGIVDRSQPYQATYVAALERGRIAAVAAHAWNGVVLLQAPRHAAAAARAAAERSGRQVRGLAGPWEQVSAVRDSLELRGRQAAHEGREVLLALDLDDLLVPAPLAEGRLQCRRPAAAELALLGAWRARFHVEVLGAGDDDRLAAAARHEIEEADRQGDAWVLIGSGRPVAYTGFNARLVDLVQIGGVWTPPELRRRGYARAAVAGSLPARERGVRRAVLFTGEENQPALRAYASLGFRAAGDYGLVLFRPEPA